MGFILRGITMNEQQSNVDVQPHEQLPPCENSATTRSSKFIARFLAAFFNQVPLGYEDKDGFHIGSRINTN